MTCHEELIRDLQAWAYHQDMRHRPYARAANDDEPTPDENPISRARQFAPGTREAAAKLLRGRDGHSRRVLMGAAAGVAIVPTWACDPVPCKDDGPRHGGSVAIDRGIPPEYEWVQRALIDLQRTHPVRAIAVETEFTVNASQLVRARIAAEKYGGRLSKSQYRRELALGLSFLAGKQPA